MTLASFTLYQNIHLYKQVKFLSTRHFFFLIHHIIEPLMNRYTFLGNKFLRESVLSFKNQFLCSIIVQVRTFTRILLKKLSAIVNRKKIKWIGKSEEILQLVFFFFFFKHYCYTWFYHIHYLFFLLMQSYIAQAAIA